MVNPNGKEKIDDETYNNSSKTLQSLVIIFLAFILFFSYVLIPYYFMGDKYQSQKNIVYFLPMIGKNLSSIKESFQNFSRDDSNYLKNITNINTEEVAYFNKINSTKELYDQFSKNITTPKSVIKLLIEENISSTKTYLSCYLTKTTFDDWTKCNAEMHRSDSKKVKSVILDEKTTKAVNGKISNVKNLLGNISLYNDKAGILNSSDLSKWKSIILNWNQLLNESSNIMKINYITIEKYLSPNYYAEPSKSPKDRQNLTANIENEIKSYAKKLESLEYPIVGKVPLVNINGAFLSFPLLVAIGFSFLSLQFKKLIRIRKDLPLNNSNEKDKILMSWIDPLQPFPERIFPLTILIIPFILFVIFLVFIGSLWYENNPYMLGSVSGDLLWVPNKIKVIFSASILFGSLILGFSYGQIVLGWLYHRRSED